MDVLCGMPWLQQGNLSNKLSLFFKSFLAKEIMNIYFIAGSPRKNVSSTVCTHTSCTSTCWFYLPVYMHQPSRLQLLHLELVQNNSCHQEIPGNKNAQLPLHVCIPACFFCCVPSYLKTCTFIPYKVSPNIFFEYPKITGCARLIPSTHSYTETVDFYILPVSLRPVVLHRFALPGPSLKRSVKGGQDNPGF